MKNLLSHLSLGLVVTAITVSAWAQTQPQPGDPPHVFLTGVETGDVVPAQPSPSGTAYHEPAYIFFASHMPLSAPNWSEYCPAQFLTAQASPELSNQSDQTLVTKAAAASTLKHPRQADKATIDAYWANRHRAFENEVATCNTQSANPNNCYIEIRKSEEIKNEQYHQAQRPQPQNVLVPLNQCQSNGAGGFNCFNTF